MEKEIAFEVLKVTKTDSEKELEQAFNDFKEMCRIYEKILGEKNSKENIKEITADLIADINKHAKDLRELARKDFR